jgi:hypothetical protein
MNRTAKGLTADYPPGLWRAGGWTSSFILLTFAFLDVPVVQRIERRFPKAKTVFLLEFADVSSSE